MPFTAGATANLKDAVLVLFHWSVSVPLQNSPKVPTENSPGRLR